MTDGFQLLDLPQLNVAAVEDGQFVYLVKPNGERYKVNITDVVEATTPNPLLLLDTTPVATTAVTTEETLFSQNVGGRWEIGEMRRIVVGLTTAANNHVKTMRVKIGAVEIYNSATASPTDTTPNDARVVVDFLCTRITETTMYITGAATISDSDNWISAATGEITGLPATVGLTIAVTGQNGTASAGDIQFESISVIKVGNV
jgi:hypothetical protein